MTRWLEACSSSFEAEGRTLARGTGSLEGRGSPLGLDVLEEADWSILRPNHRKKSMNWTLYAWYASVPLILDKTARDENSEFRSRKNATNRALSLYLTPTFDAVDIISKRRFVLSQP
jgi:hypothetical protein